MFFKGRVSQYLSRIDLLDTTSCSLPINLSSFSYFSSVQMTTRLCRGCSRPWRRCLRITPRFSSRSWHPTSELSLPLTVPTDLKICQLFLSPPETLKRQQKTTVCLVGKNKRHDLNQTAHRKVLIHLQRTEIHLATSESRSPPEGRQQK